MNARTEHVIDGTVPDRIVAFSESDARDVAARIVYGLNNSRNGSDSGGAHINPWGHEATIHIIQRVIMAVRAGAQ